MEKGAAFADSFVQSSVPFPSTAAKTELENYFDAHDKGAGIWKYRHYFPIYERHFRKFTGEEVHILEIGVYSGGSLEMWRHYFGERAFIYGVDINESCRVYENDYTRIDIGDQASRAFWATFRQKHPRIDIIIDDGGHEFDQQRVTFEEMFPHLQPGGIYLCEDLAGVNNPFVAYLQGFAAYLNTFNWNVAEEVSATPTPLQANVSCLHFYPFVAVAEKRETPLEKFSAPRRGTQWQPFLR